MQSNDLFTQCLSSLSIILVLSIILLFFRKFLNYVSGYILIPLVRVVLAVFPAVMAGVAGYLGADNANYSLEQLGYSSSFNAIGMGIFFGTIMPVFLVGMLIVGVAQFFRFILPLKLDIPISQIDTTPGSPTFGDLITVFRTPEEFGCALASLSAGWSLLAAPIAGGLAGYYKSIGDPLDPKTVSFGFGAAAFVIFALQGLIVGILLVRKTGAKPTGVFSVLAPAVAFAYIAHLLEPATVAYGIPIFASIIMFGVVGVIFGLFFSALAPQFW